MTLTKFLKSYVAKGAGAAALVKTKYDWKRRASLPSKRHCLKESVIVSLTSYPPRYSQLEHTIKCLMNQTVQPDKVVLWIAHSDGAALPQNVRSMTEIGLSIEMCEDLKSYKKILPSLRKFPKALVVTADDDLYYRRTWLEELLYNYDGDEKLVLCHRAHNVTLGSNGLPRNYSDWQQNTNKHDCSELIFPTGGAGALYTPGVFHADVQNIDLIQKLCPTGDDIWLYWMARRNGAKFRKVGRRRPIIPWPGTQESSLRHINVPRGGGNDIMIANMVRAYGFPSAAAGSYERAYVK
jgi:protein O-GlcNAc transferase